jgi:surface polysaccharide O-acyltransferase-like enzyme
MSMVSLTIAPLLASYKEDFQYWYLGLVPLTIAVILTWILSSMNILTWDDPLAGMLSTEAPAGKKAMV